MVGQDARQNEMLTLGGRTTSSEGFPFSKDDSQSGVVAYAREGNAENKNRIKMPRVRTG